jgi:hypothetical protein
MSNGESGSSDAQFEANTAEKPMIHNNQAPLVRKAKATTLQPN